MSEHEGKYDHPGVSSVALLRVGRLMWPRWIEVRGCVLREGVANSEEVADWLNRTDGSVQQAEWALNHVHLYDEVEPRRSEPERLLDERLTEVAHRLAASWSASIHLAFPDRRFTIDVALSDGDYGPTVYAVSEAPR